MFSVIMDNWCACEHSQCWVIESSCPESAMVPNNKQSVWEKVNKRQCVSVSYYVNIRFIANVQSYPNTIVNNLFSRILYSNKTVIFTKKKKKKTL